MKNQAAQFIRIITVPPILAIAMLLLLYYSLGNEFAVPSELCMAIICLAVIPGLAYPISFFMKKDSESLRKRQRNIAFLFNLLGYLIAMFCSCVMPYLFLSYCFGFPAVLICIGLYLIEFWASVALKRHTIREFLIGSLTAILVFAITIMIFS